MKCPVVNGSPGARFRTAAILLALGVLATAGFARAQEETTDADASVLGRTFAGRLQAHEPIYFVYGTGPEAAKFQFSFKYRIAELGARSPAKTRSSLQLGYTERSLWDVDSVSSPFYDTSYMPELFWEWIKIPPGTQRGVSFNAVQAGFKHESNGKEGADSRSVNIVYLRTGFFVGSVDGWHFVFSPEVWAYVDDGDDVAEYRGYGKLRGTFGKADGGNLKVTGMAGKGFDHRSVQLDLTVPVHIGFLDMSIFVMAQYFNGYGESLLAYDRKTESVRFGFAVVR
ncbi:MAG: phospholipase A [Holophagales bacterium]|nr:phospholipase A [Holophagales bacterium]